MPKEKDQRIKKANKILDHFSKTIDAIHIGKSFSQAIDIIKKCDGKIITSGMGKAGLAMRKFSCTLCSLGIPSCYLHPGEAAHGDLGVIGEKDILFVASTSGKTREVIETIKNSRAFNSNPVLCITSHPESPLRDISDVIIDMGVVEEAGDIKMAPNTSILVIMAITDALSIVLSEEKGFSKEDFAKYHHAGYLGSLARNDNNIL